MILQQASSFGFSPILAAEGSGMVGALALMLLMKLAS